MVQIFAGTEVVATYVKRLSGSGYRLRPLPTGEGGVRDAHPHLVRTTAAQVGPHCVAVVAALRTDNAIHHLRSAQGILGLREKNGLERLEAACARALGVGDPSYRTIKGILAAGQVQAQPPGPRSQASPAATWTSSRSCSCGVSSMRAPFGSPAACPRLATPS